MLLSFITKMRCAKCGREYSADKNILMCLNKDGGRLDISYDYSKVAEKISKRDLAKRFGGVWKYRELLPVFHEENMVNMEVGNTPLLRSEKLSNIIGLKRLYLKDETRSLTGSFKDRSMTVGVSKAVEIGATETVTASSGNAAAALAAHSAKAGLRCHAFVPELAPDIKLNQIQMYGAEVVRVKAVEEGKDPTVLMLLMTVEKYGWYPCPSFGPFNPYQVEGPKTMVYEIIEQLSWNAPDWIIAPTGSGCLILGLWKGLKDFLGLGIIDSSSKLVAIQSDGCAPLVRAFKQQKDPFAIEPWTHPDTIAGGLMDVFPWDGDGALSAMRETCGIAESVSDKEILESQKLLASEEGIFAEPTGVASLAGLTKLVNQGVIKRDESVVVLITGSGLKDPGALSRQSSRVPTILPNFEAYENLAKA